MPDTRIAKVFKDGSSQTIRLPAEFRFEGDEVYVTRDEATGDVVLSRLPGAGTWEHFFDLMSSIDVPPEFMSSRPMNAPPTERNLFGEDD